jgi:hypothetical protein
MRSLFQKKRSDRNSKNINSRASLSVGSIDQIDLAAAKTFITKLSSRIKATTKKSTMFNPIHTAKKLYLDQTQVVVVQGVEKK